MEVCDMGTKCYESVSLFLKNIKNKYPHPHTHTNKYVYDLYNKLIIIDIGLRYELCWDLFPKFIDSFSRGYRIASFRYVLMFME